MTSLSITQDSGENHDSCCEQEDERAPAPTDMMTERYGASLIDDHPRQSQHSPGFCTHVALVGPKLVRIATSSAPAPANQAPLDLFSVTLARVELRQRPHRALDGVDVDSPSPPSGCWIFVEVSHREGPESRVDDVLGEELCGERRGNAKHIEVTQNRESSDQFERRITFRSTRFTTVLHKINFFIRHWRFSLFTENTLQLRVKNLFRLHRHLWRKFLCIQRITSSASRLLVTPSSGIL